MDWKTFFTENARTFIWPVTVGGALFFFRENIRTLIGRISKIDGASVSFDPVAAKANIAVIEGAKVAKDKVSEELTAKIVASDNKEERESIAKELDATNKGASEFIQAKKFLEYLGNGSVTSALESIFKEKPVEVFGRDAVINLIKHYSLVHPTPIDQVSYHEMRVALRRYFEGLRESGLKGSFPHSNELVQLQQLHIIDGTDNLTEYGYRLVQATSGLLNKVVPKAPPYTWK